MTREKRERVQNENQGDGECVIDGAACMTLHGKGLALTVQLISTA